MHKNTLYKGRSTLVAMVTTAACSYRRKKKLKFLFLYLELNKTLQIGTSIIHSNIIRLYIDSFNFPWE